MAQETELTRLRDPFAPEDIEWRVQTAGEKNGKPWARVLAYVTNRAIMDRLDEVVGPANWQNVYKEGPAGGVICGLSVRVARSDGTSEWVTKWDGAENSDVEPVKGGLSNSMKRAAVQWGLGRYLYDLEEGWAQVHDGGRFSAKTKDGKWFKWDPPTMPEWALPKAQVASVDQLARIDALLSQVRNAKVAGGIRKRVAEGLTRAAADDAIRFLEARIAVETESQRAA
ncbi:Rad52/22 double-strand break repair protein [Gemmatirosa kalamazoonensis]|uniref:Rad52/22 double-strand break repair protein n=1 Tax=Gemmatirosa kalamazoonensis TaxID=861299 RepID=W0RKH9_9BACT|nr:Rad52/Rad22 family DNA repair protein [Gemmatirosa kalamazoonensis]AHG91261.1 Rad52/22 double-strand break repair protein [Gemmatirosa kalamazoonensis]